MTTELISRLFLSPFYFFPAHIQTHVCVQQTVIDLLSKGIEVHVVADAVSSRSQMDRIFALEVIQINSFF